MDNRIIPRPRYSERIAPFIGVPVIKILTGVRRCGKSTLLAMIADEVAQEEPKRRILRLNLESQEGLTIRTSEALMDYIANALPQREELAAVFLDEVQQVPEWEKVINALRVDWNCDIYITGSNSTMLASELSTHLAGRYIEFPIRPLAFREFVDLHRVEKEADLSLTSLFDTYLSLGGFPALKYFHLEEDSSAQYLDSVFDTVVMRDVLQHFGIRDIDIFRRILRYAIGNIGRTFSAHSLAKYLKSEGRSVSVDTILNYLEYCQQAYLIAKVSRLDVVGKQMLRANEKYYVVDQGLRTSLGFDNRSDIELTLENIVYNELLSRGYSVQVGWHGAKEIDFIARKDSRYEYFQVSYLLADQSTADREFSPLEALPDNHPKTVISMDPISRSRNGIRHLNIIEFLMEDPLQPH